MFVANKQRYTETHSTQDLVVNSIDRLADTVTGGSLTDCCELSEQSLCREIGMNADTRNQEIVWFFKNRIHLQIDIPPPLTVYNRL